MACRSPKRLRKRAFAGVPPLAGTPNYASRLTAIGVGATPPVFSPTRLASSVARFLPRLRLSPSFGTSAPTRNQPDAPRCASAVLRGKMPGFAVCRQAKSVEVTSANATRLDTSARNGSPFRQRLPERDRTSDRIVSRPSRLCPSQCTWVSTWVGDPRGVSAWVEMPTPRAKRVRRDVAACTSTGRAQ